MHFARDSLLTFATVGLTFLLGAASSVLIARYLGPAGKGLFTLVFLLPTLCASLGGMGLGAANVYLLRRGEARLGTLIANSAAVAFGSAILASTLLAISWPWVGPSVLPGVPPTLAVLGLLSLPLALLTDYLLSLLLGAQRLVRYNAVSLVSNTFTLLAPAVALVAFGAGVRGAVAAKLLASLVTLMLVSRALLSARGADAGRLRLDLGALRRALGYGAREHLGNVAMFLSYRADMFFVAAFMGLKAVGIYSIAVMMAEAFLHLPNAVSTVLFPRLAGKGRDEGAREAARTARVVSTLVATGALLSIPLIVPVLRIAFTSAFLPAAPAFFALVPGVYALSVSKVLSRYFTGTLGQPLLNARAQGTALAVNLPLNLVLIPAYGIVGAAAASSIAYLAHAVVMLALFRRHSGLPVSAALLLRNEDVLWVSSLARSISLKIWRERHA
jgi:O-antigen/teichoic acid export membrane protein